MRNATTTDAPPTTSARVWPECHRIRTKIARMKQTRTANLSDLTCYIILLENNTMGRNRTNLVYEYFVYDKEKNTSKCGFCDRLISGQHGSNLLYHLSSHHLEEYHEVRRRNMENKGSVVLNESDGTTAARLMENFNDTRSPKNLKEEANDQETEEYEGTADPLESSDDDGEPPQKRERRSIKIELAQASSSLYAPNEKHIKTYKVATQADKFDMLGKTVAMKLRDIAAADDKQRLMAEKIINDALFYAEMGQLTLAHCNKMSLE